MRSILVLILACLLFAACGDRSTPEAAQPVATVRSVPTVQPATPAQPASPGNNGDTSNVLPLPPDCPSPDIHEVLIFPALWIQDIEQYLLSIAVAYCNVSSQPLMGELYRFVDHTAAIFVSSNPNGYTSNQHVESAWGNAQAEALSSGLYPLTAQYFMQGGSYKTNLLTGK